LSALDKPATDDLFRNIKVRTFKKGDHLLSSGKVSRHLFFINEGFTKMYFIKDDQEFIMRFFSEGVLFTAFESYLASKPSKYAIVALETTTVTLVDQQKMEELCKKHHRMETFFRKLVSIAVVKMTKRISEMLEENATERYNQFVNENRIILHRVSLGDMAKYLGITQQSLSRIRMKK
jgi:CRP-like cAMP-binding protein